METQVVDIIEGEDQALALLDAGPLNAPAEERAVPQLDALRREYERLLANCEVRPERVDVVDRIVDRLVAARARYAGLETSLRIPWFVSAVIHSLESGQRFDRHLHNGDPLTRRTTHVPAGRPIRGTPPFTWEASAQDALELKGFDRWEDWSVAGALYKLEQYNGWGYRQFHPEVLSPYLWSFSTHYTKGKYVADGRYDPNAVSQQAGAAVLLRRMVDRDLISGWMDAPGAPMLAYSGGTVLSHGAELQRFLNTLPGINLQPDGKLGRLSSDAFRRAFGYLLRGDPRLPNA
jgi:lysozyme family protein